MSSTSTAGAIRAQKTRSKAEVVLSILFYLLGAFLIGVGVADVFFTVLAYDTAGLFVERGYRLSWRAIRMAAGYLPDSAAGFLRSLGAPLMVVASVMAWMALQILGFALLYYPSIRNRAFELHHLPHSFLTALYFSAATITSLSFSGVGPSHIGAYWLSAAEALVGLGILTLSIAYVLGLYGVVQDAAVAWVSMQNHAGRTEDARSLLVPHFRGRSTEGLSVLWRDLHLNITVYLEGMRRYPVVYYFHTRHRRRSLPYMFNLISETASAVRWGLPSDHPAALDPWLPGLIEGYQHATQEIESRFMTTTVTTPEPPVDIASFLSFRATEHPGDGSVGEFLAIERFMTETAKVAITDDPSEAYSRYCDWWRFTAAARLFVNAASAEFGTSEGDALLTAKVAMHAW